VRASQDRAFKECTLQPSVEIAYPTGKTFRKGVTVRSYHQLAVLLLLAVAAPLAAQQPRTSADQLALEFSKFKNEAKIKHGVVRKKYKEVVSTPWRALVATSYAGTYTGLYSLQGEPFTIELRMDAKGNISGRGSDIGDFELRAARITDAVLTARKLYADGKTENLEAVFLKRSARSSADESFITKFGIGILIDPPAGTGVWTSNHAFLEKR